MLQRLILLLWLLVGLPVIAQESFSHAEYDRLLRTYVRDGKMDYDALREHDSSALERYAASLATADVESLDEQQQMAFWVNAYNALVLQAVVEGLSPADPRNRKEFFQGRRFRLAGREMSLDEIEHQGLRRLSQDPRIHFALVCAAEGCPVLKPGAYRGEDLDFALDQSARLFINDPRRLRLDADQRTVFLSPIFRWYAQDFADSPREMLDYLAGYLPEHEAAELRRGEWRIEFLEYDWTLNEAP